MATIAFIGLGNMGLPMAQNLIKAGHAVSGFDVNKDAAESLRRQAVRSRIRLSRMRASDAEFVITMLPAGEQVRTVYLGVDGVLGEPLKARC